MSGRWARHRIGGGVWAEMGESVCLFLRHFATFWDMLNKYVNPVRRCGCRGDSASKWAHTLRFLYGPFRGGGIGTGRRAEDGERRTEGGGGADAIPRTRWSGGRSSKRSTWAVEEMITMANHGSSENAWMRAPRAIFTNMMSVYETPLSSALCYLTLNQAEFSRNQPARRAPCRSSQVAWHGPEFLRQAPHLAHGGAHFAGKTQRRPEDRYAARKDSRMQEIHLDDRRYWHNCRASPAVGLGQPDGVHKGFWQSVWRVRRRFRWSLRAGNGRHLIGPRTRPFTFDLDTRADRGYRPGHTSQDLHFRFVSVCSRVPPALAGWMGRRAE